VQARTLWVRFPPIADIGLSSLSTQSAHCMTREGSHRLAAAQLLTPVNAGRALLAQADRFGRAAA
jgi:hypothetical protein